MCNKIALTIVIWKSNIIYFRCVLVALFIYLFCRKSAFAIL
jgi:hypothetical protein